MTEAKSSNSIWDRIREQLDALGRAAERNQSSGESQAERLNRRARLLRTRLDAEGDSGSGELLLAFSKGRQRYGIPATVVREVQPLDHYTPVPNAPRFVRGVVQCRGEILALLDLGALFDVAETGLADVHVYLVVEGGGKRVALSAGELEDLLHLPEASIRQAPALPAAIPPEWVIGVHGDDRLILQVARILDDERLVNWRTG